MSALPALPGYVVVLPDGTCRRFETLQARVNFLAAGMVGPYWIELHEHGLAVVRYWTGPGAVALSGVGA